LARGQESSPSARRYQGKRMFLNYALNMIDISGEITRSQM
jgi:hypothetical protein